MMCCWCATKYFLNCETVGWNWRLKITCLFLYIYKYIIVDSWHSLVTLNLQLYALKFTTLIVLQLLSKPLFLCGNNTWNLSLQEQMDTTKVTRTGGTQLQINLLRVANMFLEKSVLNILYNWGFLKRNVYSGLCEMNCPCCQYVTHCTF